MSACAPNRARGCARPSRRSKSGTQRGRPGRATQRRSAARRRGNIRRPEAGEARERSAEARRGDRRSNKPPGRPCRDRVGRGSGSPGNARSEGRRPDSYPRQLSRLRAAHQLHEQTLEILRPSAGQLTELAESEELAVIENGDQRTELLDDLHDVARQDDRDSSALQRLENFLDRAARDRVDALEWLVEKDHARSVKESRTERELLL